MKKSDFWKRIWIHIRKRLPPDIDKKVMTWNSVIENGDPVIIESYIAHYTAIKILEGETNISHDRFFTHWCLIEGPEK